MNRTRKRWPLAMVIVLAATILLGLPALSSAETFTATASLSDTTASVGHPILASVDFRSPFASIDAVCFEFTFQGNLLDPGDFLRVTPLSLLPSLTGPGFFNPGPESQSSRTLCLLSAFGYESMLSLFLDGSESHQSRIVAYFAQYWSHRASTLSDLARQGGECTSCT